MPILHPEFSDLPLCNYCEKIPMQSFLFSTALIIANIGCIDFARRHIKSFVSFIFKCLSVHNNTFLIHKWYGSFMILYSCNENSVSHCFGSVSSFIKLLSYCNEAFSIERTFPFQSNSISL